ncbi:hypothetical protein DL95DRAFT_501193 [Leptodontidium sp. 2 PMI_412]|nr:hypothetical protein BKA61DRAFT_573453 [Leptodontidium sp. MPI-SDFR-AT-0119]KAH9215268.1 hypothetical protein DL95DRAFT_501193 [Leptodontidium sp. 2 PMI_412]
MAENKKGAWTDAENYALVYQIVQQLLGESKTAIKFDKITLPGRTTRALSERWFKIKNDVNAAGIVNQGPAGIPVSRAPRGTGSGKKAKGEGKAPTTPSKRKGKDEDDMMDTTPTPKRRRSPVKNHTPLKNEPDAEESEDMPVLHDTIGDDDLTNSPKSYHSYDYYE